MNTQIIRNIIALSVIIIFLSGSCLFLLYPVLSGIPVSEKEIEHLRTFNSIYSGIVGTILGYYFGKNEK